VETRRMQVGRFKVQYLLSDGTFFQRRKFA
jgi:hypothetical protein